jgi:hypothetical protein
MVSIVRREGLLSVPDIKIHIFGYIGSNQQDNADMKSCSRMSDN